jgi:hypothetical protein
MMPSKDTLTDMERVSVQLTTEAKKQIIEWANNAHVKPGYFMSMALTVGARALARTINPEQFMGPDVWKGIADAMGVEPEQVQRLVAEADAKEVAELKSRT